MGEPHVDDAGFGAAARMGIEMYDQACRSSGRTHRMIMALAPNSIVLCHGEPQPIRHMIRHLRGASFPFDVEVCSSMRNVADRIWEGRAKNRAVVMDHYLIKHLYMREITYFTSQLSELGIEEHKHSLIHNRPPPAVMFKID